MLRLLVLRTGQLERLRDFYARLGVPLVAERHGDGPLHYAGDLGGAVLELYPLPEGTLPESPTPRLGLTVSDLNALFPTLEAVGDEVIAKPRPSAWGLRGVVRDPDGRAVELYQG